MSVRGIRGATTVDVDSVDAILDATRELLEAIVSANRISLRDIASIVFTVTSDLTSEYPARAARQLGWTDVALIGATEMEVAGGLERCIRVLFHVNTAVEPGALNHVYLREARKLRPDHEAPDDAER